MDGIDPDTLLEWLQSGVGEEREIQLMALEQLCMLLLMSDNIDRCFESCPPRTFLPALCKIFVDQTAPDNILEVTARAITYYLDVSNECTRRITQVEGAVKAICNRLAVAEMQQRASKDLAEQCVKVLELMCQRETGAIFEAGGLQCVLSFVQGHGGSIHKDTLHSAMSVVTRLCGKMEPTSSALPECAHNLSQLLTHTDPKVCECALRCFATLADRFMRREVDPVLLSDHGNLVQRLLESLLNSGPTTAGGSSSVCVVLSLLSNLCRGSAQVSSQIFQSPSIVPALTKALQHKDERCVLDTLRLVDLLLVLLCEGRTAIPKCSSIPSSARVGASISGNRLAEYDRTHRHLIDSIRQKDTDALIEAIETGGVEVNFTDDVGQTLLNWASAFGTAEMVVYLCDKGADVNKGQRSSSLHYASCFGRPEIARILLRYGANPDLRDEEGKTALDKARERSDDGHREVCAVLESPRELLQPPASQGTQDAPKAEEMEPSEPFVPDQELVSKFLDRLLPVFCELYQHSMVGTVRRASLSLMRKAVHYIQSNNLHKLCEQEEKFSENLVEVLVSVLDQQDDVDGHSQVLLLMKDLLEKDLELWLSQFVRLGLFSILEQMASQSTASAPAEATPPSQIDQSAAADDAWELVNGRLYSWKDWRLIRSRDSLFFWCDACAIELSYGSNGWFRFLLDGRLSTMYSSGSPESGSDNSDTRAEFVDKLQRSRQAVPTGTAVQAILSAPNASRKVIVGNWSLECVADGQLNVRNTDGSPQRLVLSEDLPGFTFESNRQTRHCFSAESTLGPDFVTGWTARGGRRLRFRQEAQKQKVLDLAREIYQQNKKAAHARPREAVCRLQQTANCLKNIGNKLQHPTATVTETTVLELRTALCELRSLITDERLLSTYELATNGLVDALLALLPAISVHGSLLLPVLDAALSQGGPEAKSTPLVILAHKLVAVLESLERLPQFLYDSPGGSAFGLQLLSRRLRFKLEMVPKEESQLLERTGRTLKAEPLATVGQLEQYLLKMVAKQWYDYERNTYDFVAQVQAAGKAGIEFMHQSDFDEQGLIHWLGTNGGTSTEWTNPAAVTVVHVTCSDGKNQPYGRPEDVLSRDRNAVNCHTNDDKNAWFTVDLGVMFVPSAYTLRHARGYGRSALRNWALQGSRNGRSWTTLRSHDNDTSLNEPGSTSTWPIECGHGNDCFRYIRIQQMGKNASAQTHYLSLSGLELYGKVVDIVVTGFGKTPAECIQPSEEHKKSAAQKAAGDAAPRGRMGLRAYRAARVPVVVSGALPVGARVVQTSGTDLVTEGTVISEVNNGLVQVQWDDGRTTSCHWGADGKFDITEVEQKRVGFARLETERSTYVGRGRGRGRGCMPPPPMPGANRGFESNLPPHSPGGRWSQQRYSTSTAKEQQKQQEKNAIGKKSMSTTNLFDAGQAEGGQSVTEKNVGCASAESLQHQTPSLENLLANDRSRLFDQRIPESVAETPSTTPEPPSEPSSAVGSVQTLDSVPEQAEKEDDRPTVGASTMAGGSQPVLPSEQTPTTMPNSWDSSAEYQIVDRLSTEASESTVSAVFGVDMAAVEQKQGAEATVGTDAAAEGSAFHLLEEENNARNLANLSVSAPDLAAAQNQAATGASPRRHAILVTHRGSSQPPAPLISVGDRSPGGVALMTTRETYAELLDMYTEMLRSRSSSGGSNAASEAADTVISRLIRSALAQPPPSVARSMSTPGQNEGGSLTSSLRARLNNYSEALRSIVERTPSTESELYSQLAEEVPVVAREILPMDEGADDDMYDEDAEEDDMDDDCDDFPPPRGVPADGSIRREEEKIDWRHLVAEEMRSHPCRLSHSSARVRSWDDDYILKRQFSALIPAFDPRPGRTNVNQTQDVQLPENENEGPQNVASRQTSRSTVYREPTLRLCIRGPNTSETEVVMCDRNTSVFSYIQQIVHTTEMGTNADRARRMWEPTYTLKYEQSDTQVVMSMNIDSVSSALEQGEAKQVLDCLSSLSLLSSRMPSSELRAEDLVSQKLTQKLRQQLHDPLAVAARSMPVWCDQLMYQYSWLFPLDTRQLYLRACAFGTSRAIVWLQEQRDMILEQTRGVNTNAGSGMAGSRRDDHYPEYRVGRIKHERIKVPRDEHQLLSQAMRVLEFHASRKSILEIEYVGEEGTGLGPTLEFYALVAAELQRKSLAMWLCDDGDPTETALETEMDLGEGRKPPGYYVRRQAGLFPAPMPPDHPQTQQVCALFGFLGTFLAKVLQDSRLVDLPLAQPLLKIICAKSFADNISSPCTGILDSKDLDIIHPAKSRLLRQLRAFVAERDSILSSHQLSDVEKQTRCQELLVDVDGHKCRVEDLALSFGVDPSSKVFQFGHYTLCEDGDADVKWSNVDEYCRLCELFYLQTGIEAQMRAFRDGFNTVFPLKRLQAFNPHELQMLLSGEQCPEWTSSDIIEFTEPKLGFTRESPTFLRLVDVLCEMNGEERKAFLQFTTGCSSLPPGGLSNLHPRLTIVRKVDATDGSYPSVNTCVHYLKLPDYSSKEILRERLNAATNEKGFHLN